MLVHLRDDVLREREVLGTLRALVEPHDGLEDATRGHALVLAAQDDVLLPRTEHAAQVVAETRRCVEGGLGTGEVVVEEETEHRVLATPHVPSPSTPRLLAVVAEVAVGELGRQQVGHGRLDVRGKARIARHARERRGGMHVLAPELGLPVRLLRAPAVRVGEVHAVRLHDVVLETAAQTSAHVTVQTDVPQVRQCIRHGGRHGRPGKRQGRHGLARIQLHDMIPLFHCVLTL